MVEPPCGRPDWVRLPMKARIRRALVDAAVLMEALVLGGDERGAGHAAGISASGTQTRRWSCSNTSANFWPRPSSSDAGARQPHAAQARMVRQVRDRAVVEFDDIGDVDRRILDRLVLAELLVGDVQIAKVHPAELRQAAGHRLRIVHRGCDQVVDIDVLDVERLAHVGAAGAQQRDHLVLVLDRVELGLDRRPVRPSPG